MSSADVILHRLAQHASDGPDRIAHTVTRDGVRTETTWRDHVATIRRAARAFVALGLEPGQTVGILGVTRPEWSSSCLAAQMVGGIPSGIYHTCAAEQIAYISAHAENRVLVIENLEQWSKIDAIRQRLPNLQRVIVMESRETPDDELALSWKDFLTLGCDEDGALAAEVDARLAAITLDDVATLIYTSGTTGHPKAVMLTHGNLSGGARSCIGLLGYTRDDSLVSYLPLAHIAEQSFTVYLPTLVGVTIHYAEAPEKLLEALQAEQPTIFFGVPRVWERFHAALGGKLAQASPTQRTLVRWAMDVTRAYHAKTDGDGGRPGLALRLQHSLADRLLSKIRAKIGFGNMRLAASGAAPISREVLDFFSGLGTPIYEVWGLSETTGAATWNYPGNARQGKVGPPIPDVEVAIADDGEVLVRGPNVFVGYYKDEAASAEAFGGADPRSGAFFHTGDLGTIDEEGFVTITGRKKEILITSGGKNVAPAPIENRLKQIELVGDAMVVGDGRRFLSVLLTLEEEAAQRFAQRHSLDATDLHRAPKILAKLQEELDKINENLARVESIRTFRVLPRRLTQEDDELTPTLKVKRRVVMEHFGDVVEEMYR